jgi:hypothetical protein
MRNIKCFYFLFLEKKGKPKRQRAPVKPEEANKKDEDELRKERRKSEHAKAQSQPQAAQPGFLFIKL